MAAECRDANRSRYDFSLAIEVIVFSASASLSGDQPWCGTKARKVYGFGIVSALTPDL